jgi:hypothetical protein
VVSRDGPARRECRRGQEVTSPFEFRSLRVKDRPRRRMAIGSMAQAAARLGKRTSHSTEMARPERYILS